MEIILIIIVFATGIIDSKLNTPYSRLFFLLSALIFLLFIIVESIRTKRVLVFLTIYSIDKSKSPLIYYISLFVFCLLTLAVLFFLVLTLAKIIL